MGGLLFAPVPDAAAHGFVHEEIAALTTQLRQHPGDPDVLARRAELHRHHQNPDAARRDLRKALSAHPGHRGALLALARLEHQAGNLPAAQKAIDACLAENSADAAALRQKALIHMAACQWPEAARAWQTHIEVTTHPHPDSFLSCAQALRSQTAARGSTDRALRTLLRGLEIHPRVIPLRQYTADLLIELGNATAAQIHFDFLQSSYPALQPRLLTQEADIWRAHGNSSKAAVAYRKARVLFDKLPLARRATPGFRELNQCIEQGLAQLCNSSPSPDTR